MRSKTSSSSSKPVRVKPWPSGPVHFPEEAKALTRLLAGPALPLARSDSVMAFRKAAGRLYKAKHVVSVSSGTAAIHAALAAAGVGAGDEVILTSITDYGSIAGILQLNAIPVFCDVQPHTMVMDPVDMERRITRHTKAIMPVHIGGYVADMPAIMRIARRRKIAVVEDVAQCHLALIGKKYAGAWGDFGCFSTNESKHMKSGEGGFILARTAAGASFADLFADKCYRRIPSQPVTPAFPAVNLRMSAVHAEIGICQLKRLPEIIRRHRAAGHGFEKALRGFPLLAQPYPKNVQCSYWWFSFYLDTSKTALTTQEFVKRLNAEGIPCYVGISRSLLDWELFKTLDRNPDAFNSYRPGRLARGSFSCKLPNAQWAQANLMRLPVGRYTGAEEARDFRRALAKIFAKT